MFHPVGSQSAAVYWRRRLWFLAAVIALVALIAVTAHVVFAKGTGTPVAGGHSSPTSQSPPASTTPSQTPTHQQSSRPAPSTSHASSSGASSGSSPASGSGSAMPTRCVASALSVVAVTSQPIYAVDAQPTLSLQVTNTGSAPCVQNLADSQVVLTVYNGVSRVWGSHDCKIQPGVDERTLAAHQPVKISVVWSGLSSEPACAGTRQQVGAGTYTLYPSLSGHEGKVAQFSIQ
jgi:hypothetical protein